MKASIPKKGPVRCLTVLAMLGVARLTAAVTPADFHQGSMLGGASGTIPGVAVLHAYSDQPPAHTKAEIARELFGPGYPNVSDYFYTMSRGALHIVDHGVFGPLAVADDPDTVLEESTFRDCQDPTTVETLFFGMRARLGWWVNAAAGGGSTAGALGAELREWETMALVAVSTRDGLLYSGDTIAIKVPLGQFLRNNGGTISADGSGYAATDRQFVITKVGGSAGSEIVSGDTFTLRSVSTNRYLRAVGGGGGGVVADLASPTTDSTLTLQKAGMDGLRLNRLIIDALIAHGLNFAAYDGNGDGVVTAREFLLWVVGVSPGNGKGGQNRNPSGRFRPSGSTVDVDFKQAYVGADWWVHTMAHEMAHTFGAEDLYGWDGARNGNLTLMSGEVDALMFLDPFHLMRLGWTTPRIITMGSAATSAVLRMPESPHVDVLGERRPILLYDAARYDVGARAGEYFMIEFRNGVSPSTLYDRGVSNVSQPVGLALWQIKADGSGTPFVIPAENGVPGWDRSVNTLAAPVAGVFPPYVRGNWELWRPIDGVIQPRYMDGTPANVKLTITSSLTTSTEEIVVCITPGNDPSAHCGPCVASVAVERSNLKISRLQTPPGDDKLSFKGEIAVPATPVLDPVAHGVRVVLEDATHSFFDRTLPAGGYDAVTRTGWIARGATSWLFKSSSDIGDITKLMLTRIKGNSGPIRFRVNGKNGSFMPSSLPVRAFLILDPPTASTGQCGQAVFVGPDEGCAYKNSSSTLICQ